MTTLQTIAARFGVETNAPTVTLKAGRIEMSRLFADLGFTAGAEIGVWKGKWSARLCADNPALEMLCVDPWASYGAYDDSRNGRELLENAYQEAKAILAHYHCRIDRRMSKDAAADVPDGSLDFAYIDGNHGEAFVRADLDLWVPKVRSGGIIAGHDYIYREARPYIQVKAAVDRYVREHTIAPLLIFAVDKVPSFAWVHQ